jgi:tetratricopeptide (TPR) repeat protein
MKRKKEPPAADVNALLALYNARRYGEAEYHTRALLGHYPEFGFGWKLMSRILQMQRKDALPAFQKVAELMPADPEAHYNLGVVLKGAGRLDEAVASYRKAVKLKPDFAEAHSNLGNALKELGQLDGAADSYRRAIKIKASFAEAHNNLGMVLHEQGQLDDALASYRRAAEIKPDFVLAHYNMGNAQKGLGQLDAAVTSYRQTLEIDPECIGAMLGISHICMINGEMKKAEEGIKKALRIEPNNLEACFLLTSVRKTEVGDENLITLLAAEEAARNSQTQLPNQKAIHLHFALGKCFDDIGDHDRAFPQFIEGNKLKRATFEYDAGKMMQRFSDTMKVFNQGTMERLRGGGDASRLPIFVLGFPRSGTTLTEQIIASHPDVHGAGELPDLMAIALRDIAGTRSAFPYNILELDHVGLAAWGADYIAGLQSRAPEAKRITDKMPANYFVIGLIHLMLPNAKIIHINRNPVDTCLSCFMQLFSSGQEHTYDLSELGQYYVNYVRLMEHWRSVLPAGAFLDIQYEDIVSDQESQARRLIDFCGLEWSDVCIDYHKHNRSVITASMAQVRRPIYKSSVERWRPYRKFLGPLLDKLGELDRVKL